MRYAKDGKLKELCRKLGTLSFDTPLLPESTSPEAWKSLVARRAEGKLKGMREITLKGSCIVGFYAGGQFNTLVTIARDWQKAIRIADMVAYRMGPYRLRYYRPNRPEDFNYSESQAKADWENEKEIAEVLLGIEQHLRTELILAEPGAAPATSKPKLSAPTLVTLEAKIDELIGLLKRQNRENNER